MTSARAGDAVDGSIRDFDPATDREAVIACVAGLQDFERTLDPGLPPGERVARRYLEAMQQRCRAYQGRILVAERAGRVGGFLCILARVPDGQADEHPPHAMVGELYLAPEDRGLGLGRRLLEQAEVFARERGAARLRVQVLAGNGVARGLYESSGFRDRLVELEKNLT